MTRALALEVALGRVGAPGGCQVAGGVAILAYGRPAVRNEVTSGRFTRRDDHLTAYPPLPAGARARWPPFGRRFFYAADGGGSLPKGRPVRARKPRLPDPVRAPRAPPPPAPPQGGEPSFPSNGFAFPGSFPDESPPDSSAFLIVPMYLPYSKNHDISLSVQTTKFHVSPSTGDFAFPTHIFFRFFPLTSKGFFRYTQTSDRGGFALPK